MAILRCEIWILLCITLTFIPRLHSSDYYVSMNGNDSRSGLSADASVKTIQVAADKLSPGDMLHILPGEYLQHATFKCSGTKEKPIVVKGDRKGFCIIKSWKNVPDEKFKRVPEKRFVYYAKIDSSVFNVVELDTRKMLEPAPGLSDMDHFRKTYFFDAENRMLYLHCSDGEKPSNHVLKMTVNPGYIFNPVKAKHLIFKNLVFCGSYAKIPRMAGWGYAYRSMDCENILIENCGFFFNCGGVSISKGADNTVERCVFSRNMAAGYGELAQLFFGQRTRNGKAIGNIVTNGMTHGIRFYSGAENPTAIGNIVVNDGIGMYFKATAGKRLAERNVVVRCKIINYSDLSGGRPITDLRNTFGSPSFVYDANSSNLLFDPKKADPLFCDPGNLDFRLQYDSPFRGKGPKGSAPGACKFKNDVYFLSMNGDDENNGLSVKQAFRTFKKAVSNLKAGNTLYLLPGVYQGGVLLKSSGTKDNPIIIRGRGRVPAAVIISETASAIEIANLKNIVLEKLIVQSAKRGISIENSRDIVLRRIFAFKCCAESVYVSGSSGVGMSHCTFLAGESAAVKVVTSNNVTLDSTILSSKAPLLMIDSTKNFFAEYNDYLFKGGILADVDARSIKSLDDLRKTLHCDRYSLSADPRFVWNGAAHHLSSNSPCVLAYGKGGDIGAFGVSSESPSPVVSDFKLTYLNSSNAAFSWILPNTSRVLWRVRGGWWLGRPVLSVLRYGETPDCEKQLVSLGDIFHCLTLRSLKPGTRYYCQAVIPNDIRAWLHDDNLPAFAVPKRIGRQWRGATSRILSFKTPEKFRTPHGRTYYLSPSGNDENNGLSRDLPILTLKKAGELARPGDTVLLMPGTHKGTFQPSVSGEPGYPITIKAEKTGTTVIDGSGNIRPCGVFLDSCEEIIVDGLVFKNFTAKLFGNRAGMDYGQIEILRSSNITIKNCVFDCFSQYQPCVLMKQVKHLTLLNNVFTGSPTQLQGCGIDGLHIAGNTFFYTLIRNFSLGSFKKGSKVTITHNLFAGLSKQKALRQVGSGGLLRDIINKKNSIGTGDVRLVFDENIWYFSPSDPYRFCGFEDFPKKDAPPFGIQRLRDKFEIEKNSREIRRLSFKSGIPTDYMNNAAFEKKFRKPLREGKINLTLELFDPSSILKINGSQIGARPRILTDNDFQR